MRIWLPYIEAGSGADVFTLRLAQCLEECGYTAVTTPFARKWQYFPHLLMASEAPGGTDVIIANSWNGFAFHRPGTALVIVEHHCVLDPSYAAYRNSRQALFHECFVRGYERRSFAVADAVIGVSDYTARSLRQVFGETRTQVIHNAVDTGYFTPGDHKEPVNGRPVRLLFVGNHLRRKGADMLPLIMDELGDGFVLDVTSGLRTKGVGGRRIVLLGQLSLEQLRDAYRRADLLLFPSRFEGFGYVVAEAMACGTPVVCTNASALPEVVEDGVTGLLCPLDDVAAFAAAIRELSSDPLRLNAFGSAARRRVEDCFSLSHWGAQYTAVIQNVVRAN